ncbi:CsgG/HfaB family protein [Desulfovulcanus sp.]
MMKLHKISFVCIILFFSFYQNSLLASQIKTLAIFPFENNAITSPKQYAPLSKGLSAMLITDLKALKASGLQLIEREKIDSILKEMSLGQAGMIDQNTAIKAGKILGAQSVAFGSFMVFGTQVRIDLRVINVETSEIIMAENVMGDESNFFNLEKQLAQKIVKALNLKLKQTTLTASQGNLKAAMLLSQAINALDRGHDDDANKLFKKVIEIAPNYKDYISSLTSKSLSPQIIDQNTSLQHNSTVKSVVVNGMSAISFNDAIRQALRAAVEQSAGVFISSQTEIENFVVNKDKILSRSEGYIKNYKLLKQEKRDGSYYVKIKVLVSLEKIKNDLVALKILLEALQRPKLMVLGQDIYLNCNFKNTSLAETEISALLIKKGYEVVDKKQIDEAHKLDQARLILNGNDLAAKMLGLEFGAQYVVIVQANIHDAGPIYAGTKMHSVQVSLKAKIINTQTGDMLGSVVKNSAASHISVLTAASEAIKNAAQKTVKDYLSPLIMASFQDFLQHGAPLKVYVHNIQSYSLSHNLISFMETLPDITSVKKDAWNKKAGLLILDVRFAGDNEKLATLLDGQRINQYTVSVVDTAPNRLEVEISK